MRFFFFLLFTVIICIQPLQGFFTVLNWKINQAEITEKFCVNKAKMNMHCDGKCYLSKQLKLQEDSEQADLTKKNLPKLKKLKDVEVFSEFESVAVNINKEFELQNKPISEIDLSYTFEDINICFQPPQFS